MTTPHLGAPSATTVPLDWPQESAGAAPYTYDVQYGAGATPSSWTTARAGISERDGNGVVQGYLRSLRLYGLTPATLYSVRIVSHDSTTPTSASVTGAAVQVTTAPAVTFGDLSIAALAWNEAQVAWPPASGGGGGIAYEVDYGLGANPTMWNTFNLTRGDDGRSATVRALGAPLPYTARVTAHSDQWGAGDAEAVTRTLTLTTPPAVVPVAGTVTRTTVALTWPPGTVGPGPYSYEVVQCIYHGTYPNGWSSDPFTTVAAGLTALGVTVTDLTPGTTYVFFVFARNAAGAVISGMPTLATTLP